MKTNSSNVTIVSLTDGREICLSYGVPVAAFIPGGLDLPIVWPYPDRAIPRGYMRTDAKYSVTTSRHANDYAGRDSAVVDDATFRALIAPVTGKGGR